MTPDNTNGWVRTQQDGAVLTVTLDRPDQLNAQTPATWSTLAGIGQSLDADVRVVVVRGAGRAFSAGLDRSLFSPEPGVPGGTPTLGAPYYGAPPGSSRYRPVDRFRLERPRADARAAPLPSPSRNSAGRG